MMNDALSSINVKLAILTAIVGMLGTIMYYVYVFAVDQTKKELGIEGNKAAILRIEKTVEKVDFKVDKIADNVQEILIHYPKRKKKTTDQNDMKNVDDIRGVNDEKFVLRKR